MAKCSSKEVNRWVTLAVSRARNSTIRPAGHGRPRAVSPPGATFTQRLCWPTVRCSSHPVLTPATLPPARNSTMSAWVSERVATSHHSRESRKAPPAHGHAIPGRLPGFWRQHPGFIEQLPNRAVTQHRQQPGCFPPGRSGPAGRTQVLASRCTLSFRPGAGDRLYQRHPKHCEVSGRPEFPLSCSAPNLT